MNTLDAQAVREAAASLSAASGFWFTRRCLMFELCRREAWPAPASELEASEQAFAAALEAHERATGRLERLVRPEEAVTGIEPEEFERYDLPHDMFDYAIARVALVERLDLCLMLVANGMHRNIELALTVPPQFPTHVWSRINAQLDSGLRTTFLTIHDLSPSSGPWLERIDTQLATHEHADFELVPAGLTLPWLSRLQLPLREGPGGSYALIEELPPLRMMRWVYGRVARGSEDIGFG